MLCVCVWCVVCDLKPDSKRWIANLLDFDTRQVIANLTPRLQGALPALRSICIDRI